jgi:hypothetical protein
LQHILPTGRQSEAPWVPPPFIGERSQTWIQSRRDGEDAVDIVEEQPEVETETEETQEVETEDEANTEGDPESETTRRW